MKPSKPSPKRRASSPDPLIEKDKELKTAKKRIARTVKKSGAVSGSTKQGLFELVDRNRQRINVRRLCHLYGAPCSS